MTKRRKTHHYNLRKRKYKQTTINYASSKRRRTEPIMGDVGTSIGTAVGATAGGAASYAAVRGASQLPAAFEWTAAEEGISATGLFELAEAATYVGATEAAAMSGAAVAGPVVLAAGAAYLVGSAISSLFSQQKQTISSLMSGAGYFGNVSKLSKSKTKGLRDKYQGKGSVVINEVYGNVQDPDVVVVGHTSFAIGPVCRAIAFATIRKLFLKAGIIMETTSQELGILGMNIAGPNGFTVIWQTSDSDGTTATSGYAIVDNDTLESVCANSGFTSVIYDMMTDENPKKLEKIALEAPGNNFVNASQLYFKQEVLDLTCHVHTIIQNRTKAASGLADAGSTSIDQLDVQPLKGPVFEFQGVPKTKQANNALLNTSYIQGVFLARVNGLGGSDYQAWREPPVKKSFSNVIKHGYTRINPGVMKDFSVVDSHRGYFQNIITGKLKVITENGRVAFYPGRSQAVFLEEELNSGSANNISVQYETQHTIGCQLITAKAPNMQPYYEASTLSLTA